MVATKSTKKVVKSAPKTTTKKPAVMKKAPTAVAVPANIVSEEQKLKKLRESKVTARTVAAAAMSKVKDAERRALSTQSLKDLKAKDSSSFDKKVAAVKKLSASKVTDLKKRLGTQLTGIKKRVADKEKKITILKNKNKERVRASKLRSKTDPKNMTSRQVKLLQQRERKAVVAGGAVKTSTGMTRGGLVKTSSGRVVSAKKSKNASTAPWIVAVSEARKKLAVKGFVPVGGDTKQGKELHALAKKLYVDLKAKSVKK